MKLDDLIIREATLDDIPMVARLHVDSWNKTYKGIIDQEHLNNMKNNIDKRIERMRNEFKQRKMMVAILNNEIVAFTEFTINNEFSKELDIDCEFCGLYVKNEYVGIGIGSKFFDYIKTHSGCKSGENVADDRYELYVDTGNLRCCRVAADRIDISAVYSLSEHVPADNRDDRHEINRERESKDLESTDRRESGNCAADDLVVGHDHSKSEENTLRSEGHQESRDLESRNDNTVDGTCQSTCNQSSKHTCKYSAGRISHIMGDRNCYDRGERAQGRNGKVDTADQEYEDRSGDHDTDNCY